VSDAGNNEAIGDRAFQQEVFAEAFEETRKQLDKSGETLDLLRQVMQGRNEAIDATAHDFAAEAGAECGAGCTACCHQMVLCAPFEIFIIARHVLDTMPVDTVSRIKGKLEKLAALPLDEPHRTRHDTPCALLDDGRCSVYDYRPSLCRTMLSSSRQACEAHLQTGTEAVPFIAEPVIIAFLMQLGIDYALITKRLSTEKVELARALHIALAHFDEALSGWLKGEDVFPDCQPTGQGLNNRTLAENAARQCGLMEKGGAED